MTISALFNVEGKAKRISGALIKANEKTAIMEVSNPKGKIKHVKRHWLKHDIELF